MLTKRDKKYIEDEVEKISKYLVESGGPGLGKFSEITPHIFISNWASSCQGTYLRDKSIEFVICVSKDKKNRDEMKLYDAMRIHQIYIPLDDNMRENINIYFERFYDTMYAAILEEKNILVHCQTGASASVALVLYYLLKRYYVTNFGKRELLDRELTSLRNFKLKSIIEYMKERRTCVDPNLGFVAQLLTAEVFLKKQLAAIFDARIEDAERRELEDAKAFGNRRVANKKPVDKVKKTVKFKEPVEESEESDEPSEEKSDEPSDEKSEQSSDETSFEQNRRISAEKSRARSALRRQPAQKPTQKTPVRKPVSKTPVRKPRIEIGNDSDDTPVKKKTIKPIPLAIKGKGKIAEKLAAAKANARKKKPKNKDDSSIEEDDLSSN